MSRLVTTQESSWLWLFLTRCSNAGSLTLLQDSADSAGATGLNAGGATFVTGAALPCPAHMHGVGAQASGAHTCMCHAMVPLTPGILCFVAPLLLSPDLSAVCHRIPFTGSMPVMEPQA